jgi:branched-chain amino acid transport system permease protein
MIPGVFPTDYKEDMAIIRTKTQWFVVIAALVLVFTIPIYSSNYWLVWLITVCVWVIAVLGLHILTGLCGLFSVAQAAFMGVGAYTSSLLTSNLGWPAWGTLPLAAVASGLIGILVCVPALRIKGFYFAMATIAFSFLIVWLIGYFDGWTGGQGGMYVEPLHLGGIDFGEPGNYFYLALILTVVMIILATNIQRTRTGRALIAIRDNDLAAQVMGVDLFRYKSLALFIGSAYAGVAGWLWAHYIIIIAPEQFTLMPSVWMLGALFIGGMGSTAGAVLGTVGLKLLDIGSDHIVSSLSGAFPDIGINLEAYAGTIFYALVLIVFIILEPRGLYHRWQMLKSAYRLFPYSY